MNTAEKQLSNMSHLFVQKVQKHFMGHPIVSKNEFTQWFSQGCLTKEQLREFTVQFSVFSNLFLIAQLKKMINSANLDMMRASKEILGSEIGIIFHKKDRKEVEQSASLVNTQGSIEGGRFRFRAAHFEWLLEFGKPLGLSFTDMGKRSHGIQSTLHFTDKLEQLVGSENPSIAAGASFALENWAAHGFWKELVQGITLFEEKNFKLPKHFFVWHDLVEDQHAEHTHDELEDLISCKDFSLDKDLFLKSGIEILDAVKVFWDGLNEKIAKP